MPGVVTAAVLGAAALHATWNALAKSGKDPLVGFVALELAAGGIALVAAPFVGLPAAAAWPFLVASAVVHVAYQLFLMTSYRVGDLNQVYPIARGTAPLVVALLAVPFAGERLGAGEAVGVVLVATGLVSLAHIREWVATGRPPTLLLAFGTGLIIATYTLIDGLGVRRSGNVPGYAALLMLAEAVPLPLYTFVAQRARVREASASNWRLGSLGGALSFAAYFIVLWAQTRGTLAAVAALRETGVIVGVIFGTVLFHEHFGRRRLVAGLLVAGGVALINLR